MAMAAAVAMATAAVVPAAMRGAVTHTDAHTWRCGVRARRAPRPVVGGGPGGRAFGVPGRGRGLLAGREEPVLLRPSGACGRLFAAAPAREGGKRKARGGCLPVRPLAHLALLNCCVQPVCTAILPQYCLDKVRYLRVYLSRGLHVSQCAWPGFTVSTARSASRWSRCMAVWARAGGPPRRFFPGRPTRQVVVRRVAFQFT